jgi:hypothetical protein
LNHSIKYFIEFIFEPYDDFYNYGRSSDSEVLENIVLVRVILDEYGEETKKLIEILEQHGFNYILQEVSTFYKVEMNCRFSSFGV